ncbi:MAG: hypothetical protein K2G67_02340 [Muribaculaceae bacterium]|nr:hypothetical protein [Muribaculaceae bacterium]
MKLAFYLSLLTLILPLKVCADSGSQGESRQIVIKISRNSSTGRPRIPSHQRIEAYFEENILHIEFLKSEGKAYIEFLNQTGIPGLSESFDTAEPFDFEVEDITFPAEFEISTDLLNTYSGIISGEQK